MHRTVVYRAPKYSKNHSYPSSSSLYSKHPHARAGRHLWRALSGARRTRPFHHRRIGRPAEEAAGVPRRRPADWRERWPTADVHEHGPFSSSSDSAGDFAACATSSCRCAALLMRPPSAPRAPLSTAEQRCWMAADEALSDTRRASITLQAKGSAAPASHPSGHLASFPPSAFPSPASRPAAIHVTNHLHKVNGLHRIAHPHQGRRARPRILRPGEWSSIVLFSSKHAAATVTKFFTASTWDHIGLVVKFGAKHVFILEYAGGVYLYPLFTRLLLITRCRAVSSASAGCCPVRTAPRCRRRSSSSCATLPAARRHRSTRW